MASVTRPKIQEVGLGDLVQWARDGRIRLPSFQRPYQWDREDVLRLFDSLIHGYPIGSLTVWRRTAPAGTATIGPLTVPAPQTDDAYWVVDGHQRIASLVGALAADDDTVDPRFRIYYDLGSGEFHSLSRRRVPERDWLPIPLTLDTAAANAWIRERPHLTAEQIRRADDLAVMISDCRLPLYEISGDDDRTLRKIFERTNSGGVSLGRAEIDHARRASSIEVSPGGLEALSDEVAGLGFGRFPARLLEQSVLAIRDPFTGRDFRSEFRGEEELEAALHAARDALGHVVDFLRDDAGIPQFGLLPRPVVIPVLTRFTATFGPPQGRAADLLRRWVWRGAVLGFTQRTYTTIVRRNAEAIYDDAAASAERLIGALPPAEGPPWQPDLSRTSVNSVLGRVNILGLLSLRPLPVSDSAGYEAAERPLNIARVLEQNDSPLLLIPIFDTGRPEGDSIANRLVAPGAKPTQVRQALMDLAVWAPGDPGEQAYRERLLTSHCLDAECLALLRKGDTDAFLAHRANLTRAVIAKHVQNRALFGFRDGPALADLFADSAAPTAETPPTENE